MYSDHRCGVELVAENRKFKNAKFYVSEDATDADLAKGIAAIIGWHAINIWPDFGKTGEGFAGYDCPEYEVVRETFEDWKERKGLKENHE